MDTEEREDRDERGEQLICEDDADAGVYIEVICGPASTPDERIEQLASLFIMFQDSLREEKQARPEVAFTVERELDRLIGLLFKRSRAHEAALILYKGRFEIIGGCSPEDLIETLVSNYLPNEPEEKLRAAIRDPAVPNEEIEKMIDKQWPDTEDGQSREASN